MLKLLLTADYEIFGDGGGCVQKCLIQPSERLMKICESVGARITFFVDVCEYWAFRSCEDAGILPEGYCPGTWIETQIKDALKRGHDIQLHIHPQWIEHKYVSPVKWEVNLNYWRLPFVSGGYGDRNNPTSLLGLFTMGRKTLEDLLKPICHSYTCRAFRAGAWCIQPEFEVLRAMNEAGLWYDTTVAPMLKTNNGLTYFDFSNAPLHLPYWKIKDRIDVANDNGNIIEVPIFTCDVWPLRRILFKTIQIKKHFGEKPRGCNRELSSVSLDKTLINRITFTSFFKKFTPRVQMFDYCQASTVKMKYFAQKAYKQFAESMTNKKAIPLVAIGHPKAFDNESEFKEFLLWVKEQKFIALDSLNDTSFWQSNLQGN